MLCRLFFLFCVFLVLSRLVVENGKYPTAYHIFPVNATFSSLIMAFTGSKRGIWVGDMCAVACQLVPSPRGRMEVCVA